MMGVRPREGFGPSSTQLRACEHQEACDGDHLLLAAGEGTGLLLLRS